MIAGIEMSAESDPETNVQTVLARKRRYSLAELLAQCEGGPLTQEEREWLDAPDVGSEIGAHAARRVDG
jgi:antitoxin component of MazEF toxin-antitoxin module